MCNSGMFQISASQVTITQTIRCDNKGGLVGNHFGNITIQNVTLDKCNEIVIGNYACAYITNCHFYYCNILNISSDWRGSVCIHRSTFSNSIGGIYIEAASVSIENSNFLDAASDALVIFGNLYRYLIIPITITGCNFSNNSGYSVKCIGCVSTMSIPQLKVTSSNLLATKILHCILNTVM